MFFHSQVRVYFLLAVSTRPPDGANYFLGPAGLCPPYLSSFALDLFSRIDRAEVRSFISIHQVAPATALLLLLLLLRAWFIVARQVSLS